MLEDYDALIRAGEVWVLDEGGEVLGVLVIRSAEDHLFLGNVAVGPGTRGEGLGASSWPSRRGGRGVRTAGGTALHQREDAREPGRLRQAGLRGVRARARRGLPARVHAQAA